MSCQRIEEHVIEAGKLSDNPSSTSNSPTTKLERRRKIEDLHEEKRLREEIGYF